jgi:serine/threonine protein kinase
MHAAVPGRILHAVTPETFEERVASATLQAAMPASPEAQETIGNYSIERSLAHGSMGHVYVARHTLTYTRVALKVLRSDLEADAQAEERFLREVRAAAQIGHEGIVKVYDAGRSSDGRLYLAMELLSGETLEERMSRMRGERLAVMDWLLHVLEPLAAAHAQGIVHRDLKPANVFITREADGSERVKLLDFGLARDTRQKSGTETGIALGTPYYMSPEQATRPKHVGPASDVWSLGVMMYEVLSGQMPFDGETLHAVVIHSTTTPHMPLEAREPTLDFALCALVDDCLSKEPKGRPADATELLMRLQPLLENPQLREALGRPVVMHDPGHPSLTRTEQIPFAETAISFPPRLLESDMRPTPRRSTRGLWTSVFALLLVAAAGLIWALQRADSAPARRAGPQLVRSATPASSVLPQQSVGAAGSGTSRALQRAESTPRGPRLQPSAAGPARANAAKLAAKAATESKAAAATEASAEANTAPALIEPALQPDKLVAAPSAATPDEAPTVPSAELPAAPAEQPSAAELPPPEPGAPEPETPVGEPAPPTNLP